MSQRHDTETMNLFLAHFRLEALVHAASAIEYHARRIESLSRGFKHPDLRRLGSGETTTLSRDMALRAARASRQIDAIDVEWHDIVWWGRTLLGRMRHEFRSPGARQQIGLLAYLSRRETQEVRAAWKQFSRLWATELTALANYSLHCKSISRSQPKMRLTPEGVLYPIPDRVTDRQLKAYSNFNYGEKRDALTFSNELMSDVSSLVDAILDIFTRAQAERWESSVKVFAGKPER